MDTGRSDEANDATNRARMKHGIFLSGVWSSRFPSRQGAKVLHGSGLFFNENEG